MEEQIMTDDINNYTFDFAKEVNALRLELGPRGNSIIFVKVNIDRLYEEPAKILQTIGNSSILQDIHKEIRRYYKEEPRNSSFHGWIRIKGISSNYVCVREKEDFTEMFGEKNKEMLRLFLLYHETAHALISGPDVDHNHPYKECAADAYAALRLFQRFGRGAGPLLSMVSWYRAYGALIADTGHVSTPVLDRVIADSASRDFSKLNAGGTIALAQSYAEEGTPTRWMLRKLRQIFARYQSRAKSPHHASLLMDTALQKLGSRSGSQFAFYIGAKYFEPFMHPGGVEFDDGLKKDKADNNPQTQTHYRELIGNCADTTKLPHIARLLGVTDAPTGLRKMFNKLARRPVAKTSLTKFLRVTLPAGQERFIFKVS